MLPQEFNLMNFYTGTSSAGSDMFALLILFFFFFTRKRFVSSWNLHHLNLDHVKLNRLCIDCVLGRKNTNGTFSSLTVSKSLQNVFKIDVIAIWRCREKKLRRRWFSLIARFISARRQKKSWLCNDALKNIALWIKDSSLVTFFVFIRLLRE